MSSEEIDNPEVKQPETNVDAEHEADQQQAEVNSEKLLEDARNKADEHWNELLRARADMENLRRRQARDLENAHKHALDKFVAELLPIYDSMELGLNAANSEEASLETVRDGLEMTMKMFLTSISKFGLEQVNPEGQAFDPELHQAMAMQEVEGVEANQVLTVAQKGYQFNGRLLRPAMVVVSQ
ncbi:MAG: nucleotide exchange factor GrpE [Gammaproteobacteria bacterium]|nr:nucleotide exchange factor GrpE [Gammaproteobacteria bacterium]MDH5591716.1 nucleotide exchange factor GrpE [Gammaproteobacteria bacterium]